MSKKNIAKIESLSPAFLENDQYVELGNQSFMVKINPKNKRSSKKIEQFIVNKDDEKQKDIPQLQIVDKSSKKTTEQRSDIGGIQKEVFINNYTIEQQDISVKKQQQITKEEKNKKSIKKLPPIQFNFQKYQATNNSLYTNNTLKFRNGKAKINAYDIVNLNQFINKPIPHGCFLSSVVHRNRTFCNTKYQMFLNQDSRLLISSQKQRGINSNYFMMLEGKKYGQVQGNFFGSQFNIYEDNELTATVCYLWVCSCSKTSRKIQIYLRNPSLKMGQLDGEGKSLKERFNEGQNHIEKRIYKYVNKEPIYNIQTDSYYLNFSGLAQMTSVKNVIFTDDFGETEVFIFAKRQQNIFNVLLFQPFSINIAMGIISTMLDFKLVSQ